MATSLLQTKLYIPPPRPEQVPRPRLIERLNAGLHRKLILLSAPAGFGKTTLLSEWIASHRRGAPRSERRGGVIPPAGATTADKLSVPRQVAWLSLDESDNDPTRFLTYLLAALQAAVQTAQPKIGKGALAALESPQPPPPEAILTDLINDLVDLPEPITLVLDDYHQVQTQVIHDALAFLLEHLPPLPSGGGLHLIIATREDPPLPLARLRARGQLAELRATDLRFTPDEAAKFLNQAMGLGLAAGDVAALETRTEGWIAGLQLAALALQGTGQEIDGFIESFTGSHRFVLDYLAEEVLHQQPESVQSFLLQTAILDRMTGPLCDAVRFGDPRSPGCSEGTATLQSSAATLEQLDRANLFIVPLDQERRWYRYHHLFADLLRRRLHQTQPDGVGVLHERASEWYRHNGFIDEAVEHALRAGWFERAGALIEEHVDAVWQRGEHTTLRRWLDELPGEQVSSNPQLCIAHAWNLFTSGQHDAAWDCLQSAERALATGAAPAENAPPHGPEAQVRGRIAALRAFLALYDGDLSETVAYARRALKMLPKGDVNWRTTAGIALGDAYSLEGQVEAAYQVRREAVGAGRATGNLALIAGLKLADTCRQQGQLQRTIALCEQQWQLAQEHGLAQTVTAGWLMAIWGETLAELGDLDRALERAAQGVERAERGQDATVTGWSRLSLVRVLFSREELDAAQEIVDRLVASARSHDLPPFITHATAAWQARIWLAEGKLEAASQWARERGPEPADASESLALARIWIAQGRPAEAGGLLQGLIERAQAGGHTSCAIEGLVLQAWALQVQGDSARSLSALEQALLLAEPGGTIRTFVDEGPPVAGLLYQAAARGIAPAYASKLLAAFPAPEAPLLAQSQISVPTAGGTEIIEPLSEREIEVLHLLAEGLTNPEIAARLTLALNTVKSHTRSIYGKLDVHNRTQAVGRARALGILPAP